MILSDTSIVQHLKKGRIRIEPRLRLDHLRPAGIRVHLGSSVLIPKPGQLVDLAQPKDLEYDQISLEKGSFVLEPSSFILASTVESVKTSSDLLCILDGRSTIARLGLTIHNSASVLDGTHIDFLTPVLEISNHGNMRVVLRHGMPIGMICFQQLADRSSKNTHHNQYANQRDTTPPILERGAMVLPFGDR